MEYINTQAIRIAIIMKTRPALSFLLLLTALTSLARLEARPRQQDHLVPFETSVFDEFRPSLYQKLLVTPGNYGRMIEFVDEPDRGEFAVSVQCEERSVAGKHCSVTLTKAKQNLGSIMVDHWGKRPLELINRVRAIRKDAPLGPATALAVRSAWTKMLRHVKPRREDGSVVVDALRIEFCIGPPNPAQLFAQIPERPGKSVVALVELGRLLAKYSEAPESARASMEKNIERDARRLAASLP
jgi:hypothetical protein